MTLLFELGILTDCEAAQLSHLKCRKENLLAHQVLTWKLKSRANWINEGDSNTNLFHCYASARRNSKYIWALLNQVGDMVEEDSHLKQLGVQHFSEIFKDNGSSNILDQLKVIILFTSFV